MNVKAKIKMLRNWGARYIGLLSSAKLQPQGKAKDKQPQAQ